MKTYLYKCDTCDKEKEHPSKAIAPMCCGKEMRKIWVPTNVHFKGEGFYINDKEEK